jgi:cellulose synthase/poly-beta-1,6-N-acetylglucosamine synthase-like glycosyltransferase
MTAEIIFIVALALIVYTYAGYPALMFLLSRFYAWPVNQAEITPRVSVIIAARNEERDIEDKINNTFALDYPPDKLEIVVASDCSTDRTEEIVRRYSRRGVKLYRQTFHLGKTVAQNNAVRMSSGEILVFSDATTLYTPDTLRKIVRSFADPKVGCVAGQLVYVDRSKSATGNGCRSYWSYEKFLKKCESRVGSMIGVSGCLYALRRSCHQRLGNAMIDDFVVATEIHLQGLRTIYEPEAICTEDTNRRGRDEFRMRVRVIEQTISALARYRRIFSLRHQGQFAFQMLSHKVLRYAVPFWLIAAFGANLALVDKTFDLYEYTLLTQVALYVAALIGWAGDSLKLRLGPLAIPWYFVLVNAASFVALMKYLRGDERVVWESVREPKVAGTK